MQASDHIQVGPVDTPNGVSYMYRVNGKLSKHYYANSASATHDAMRPQKEDAEGRLEPDTSLVLAA